MTQQISPFLESKYGWNYGESGWNTGADENFLKYGYLLNNNVNGVVSALPALVNGEAYFLTTDSRFYFAVGGNWYSSPCPKWFIFKIKDSGDFWWYNGVSAVAISNPQQLSDAITTIQSSISSLGTAAYVNIEDLATQAELDIASAQAAAYTDTLRSDLSADAGSSLVGFKQAGAGAVPRTMLEKSREVVSVKDFGAACDGITDDTTAIQAAVTWANSVSSARIVIPGLCVVNSELTLTCNNLELDFSIPGVSGFYFPDSNGISITQNSRKSKVVTRNMLLITGANKTRVGFYYSYAGPENSRSPCVHYNPVLIGYDRWAGLGSNENGWLVNISLDNADRTLLDVPYVQGAENDRVNALFPAETVGILLNNCTNVHIRNPHIYIQKRGIRIQGQSEGTEISQGTLVANYRGIDIQCDSDPGNDHNIRGTHISSFDYNININNGGSVATVMHTVDGCLLFSRNDTSINPNFVHIHAYSQVNISNTYFFTAGPNGAGHTAVVFGAGSNASSLVNSEINRIGCLANIASGVDSVRVGENQIVDDGATVLVSPLIVNSGTTTIITNNTGGRRDSIAYARAVRTNGSSIQFQTGAPDPGVVSFQISDIPGAVNFLNAYGATAGNAVSLSTIGADASIDISVTPKGSGAFKPSTDNLVNLGRGSNRWGVVFAGTGTINTSDAREKQQIRELSEVERAVALRLKGLIRAFKFNDAVAEKGTAARIHFGVIAQDVKAAFEAEGLVAEDYAILCYDEWEEQQEIKDEEGNTVQEYRAAGNRYGVRYDELLAFIIGAM